MEGSTENGSRNERTAWRKKDKGMIQQANDEEYGREVGQHNPFGAMRKQQHNRRQGLTTILRADLRALPL